MPLELVSPSEYRSQREKKNPNSFLLLRGGARWVLNLSMSLSTLTASERSCPVPIARNLLLEK